jgi:hypothetical protein
MILNIYIYIEINTLILLKECQVCVALRIMGVQASDY